VRRHLPIETLAAQAEPARKVIEHPGGHLANVGVADLLDLAILSTRPGAESASLVAHRSLPVFRGDVALAVRSSSTPE
jgi:hypothetical protein